MTCVFLNRQYTFYVQLVLILYEIFLEFLKYYRTFMNDRNTNAQKTFIYDFEEKGFVKACWKDIKVGHIIKVQKNEIVPADMILIETLDTNHTCAVDESSINGVFDKFKPKVACVDTQIASKSVKFNDYVKNIKGILRFEDPNGDADSFHARLKLESYPRADDVTLENFIMRGSSIKNIKHVYGIAVYTGMETKIMQILKQDNEKRILTKKNNKMIDTVNFLSIFLVLIYLFVSLLVCASFIHKNYKIRTEGKGEFAGLTGDNAVSEVFYSMVEFCLSFHLLFPLTWMNLMFICYYILAKFIQWDVRIKTKPTYKVEVINEKSLPDFGNVRYILADKTGTLTSRKFQVKALSVKGKLFTFDPLDRKDDNYIFKTGEENNYEKDILNEIRSGSSFSNVLRQFLDYLCICHSAKRKYARASEDGEAIPGSSFAEDRAVLKLLKNLGYVVSKTKSDRIIIRDENESKTFNFLGRNDYTDARNRMSVVIESSEVEGGLILSRIYASLQGKRHFNSQFAKQRGTEREICCVRPNKETFFNWLPVLYFLQERAKCS